MTWPILAGIALVIVLIGCWPIAVKAQYDENGFAAKAYFGPIAYTLYPRDKKEKKETAGKQPAKKKQTQSAETKEEKGGKSETFRLLLKQLPEFLGDFKRKLRIKHIQLKYTMAGGDPADMALNYGKAWAAIGNLWPYLERFFVIKKRELAVQCDFEGKEATVFAKLHVSITLARALGLACKYGWRLLRQMINNNKGGANNE